MTELTTPGHDRPAHSPLGASGAERWTHCTGSATPLPPGIELPERDEPDYTKAGTAAHEWACQAVRDGRDGWEFVGEVNPDNEWVCDEDMAKNIQTYADECRAFITPHNSWGVEQSIDAPDFHPLFYGTTDFWALSEDQDCLVIRDYKNGAGILVEVEENPQIMYYAYGILRRFPAVREVDLGIVQPNITWHPNGTVRTWTTSADHIREWAENELRPAMYATESDNSLTPGEWCRFCPRKLICPAVKGMFGAAAVADPDLLHTLTNAELGEEYRVITAVKSYIKAVETEALRRLIKGDATIPHIKLVSQKSNRVWRGDAEAIFKPLFGDEIYAERKLLGPAEMEKLSVQAKSLVKEYAYSPGGGPTVALRSDKRQEITLTNNLRDAAQKLLDSGTI